jgi:DNA polymerase III gamma/tau subunit
MPVNNPPVLAKGHSFEDLLLDRENLASDLRMHLGRLGQSYLFVGPSGSGKFFAAKAMAKGILCPMGGCGICGVCVSVEDGSHPDCTVVTRAGATLSVEEARAVLAGPELKPARLGIQGE